jgi:hypothetical protein
MKKNIDKVTVNYEKIKFKFTLKQKEIFTSHN